MALFAVGNISSAGSGGAFFCGTGCGLRLTGGGEGRARFAGRAADAGGSFLDGGGDSRLSLPLAEDEDAVEIEGVSGAG